MSEILKIKKLSEKAKIPTYAYQNDAGLDLFSIEDVVLEPMERKTVRTGIALEIPPGLVGLIWDKSSVAINSGVKTFGGVIDAGYRGEIQVGIMNLSRAEYEIKEGEKIAQILIQEVKQPEVREVSELSDSPRAERGFGSSGK